MTDPIGLSGDTAVPPTSSSGSKLASRLWRHRSFRIGISVFLILVLMAVLAPVFSDGDPNTMSIRNRFSPPSSEFPFGTDNFGRDIFVRVLYGARVSLWIGFSAAMIAAIGGALIGMASAWFRRLDGVIMRMMDALLAFPAILLAIGINAALGPQISSVIIALGTGLYSTHGADSTRDRIGHS